jgi:hypothetical protein
MFHVEHIDGPNEESNSDKRGNDVLGDSRFGVYPSGFGKVLLLLAPGRRQSGLPDVT